MHVMDYAICSYYLEVNFLCSIQLVYSFFIPFQYIGRYGRWICIYMMWWCSWCICVLLYLSLNKRMNGVPLEMWFVFYYCIRDFFLLHCLDDVKTRTWRLWRCQRYWRKWHRWTSSNHPLQNEFLHKFQQNAFILDIMGLTLQYFLK